MYFYVGVLTGKREDLYKDCVHIHASSDENVSTMVGASLECGGCLSANLLWTCNENFRDERLENKLVGKFIWHKNECHISVRNNKYNT